MDTKYMTTAPKNTSAVKLPPIERGSYTKSGITDHWFKSIDETANKYKDDQALQRARYAHRLMTDQITALEKLRDARNPRDTPSTHLEKVAKAADSLIDQVARNFDGVRSDIAQRRKDIEQTKRARLGLTGESKQTEEIRSILRSMKPNERAQAIADAIENEDKTVISAIWDAHPISLGVKKSEIEMFKTTAIKRHASDLMGFESALSKTENLINESFSQVADLAIKAKGDPATVNEFTTMAEAHDLAVAGFQKSLQGSSE